MSDTNTKQPAQISANQLAEWERAGDAMIKLVASIASNVLIGALFLWGGYEYICGRFAQANLAALMILIVRVGKLKK